MADPTDVDDHVARLLAKDARDCSLRYSALGVYAATPPRTAGRVPKPNTRFLRNILRDTDTHNANLKRREQEEARERMRRLRTTNRSNDDERASKRRKVKSPADRDRDKDRDREGDRNRAHRLRHDDPRDPDDSELRKHKKGSREEAQDISERRKGVRAHHSRRRHGRRNDEVRHSSSRHELDEESDTQMRDSRKPHRSGVSHSPRRQRWRRSSRSRSRDRSHRREDKAHQERNSSNHQTLSPPRTVTTSISETFGADSPHVSDLEDDDELNEFIGPLPPSAFDTPPIQSRGRGAYRISKSNMDSHFAPDYDPTLDVNVPSDDNDRSAGHLTSNKTTVRPVAGLTDDVDNDWDMALEALRDRALWRQKGAERLRQAGFDEGAIQRWEANKAFGGISEQRSNGRDKDVAEVRWAKKGEAREWDRGKVVDGEGHVAVKVAWPD